MPTLLLILLLEGFITISIEILAMRQLMPFYGGSVVITSIIIGFFLLFLALGYWRGGWHRQDFCQRLSRNFLLSMLWVGVGLSYSFIAVFAHISINLLSLSYLSSLSLYLMLILAPTVFWLGQTVPITTNLFNQNQGISQINGRALFLSTIGSFLGAIATSLLLFQFVGVAYAVVINCALLFFLVIWLQCQSKFVWWQILLLGIAFVLIKNLNINFEKRLFLLTNNYGNYQILDEGDSRFLRINESNSSKITSNLNGFPYAEFIRYLLFKRLNIKNKDLLIIGAGGFSLTAAGAHNNNITYIDIDPAIKQLAEAHFLKQAINGKFIGQDARLFLNQTPLRYDVIISDAYSHEMTIPPSLLTVEYFQQLAAHLNPSGLLVVNIIANPLFQDDFSRRLNNTIRKVFEYCTVFPLSMENRLSNIIYLCPKIASDPVTYTDDLSSATLDFFKSRETSPSTISK